jgi:hypothetical protein
MKTCLVKANANVIGTIDHGFIKSIYFFDLNVIRIEFTISAVEKKISYVRG